MLASTVPTCAAYDPAYAYEIAVIVQDGIRRMYQEREDLFYYLTLYNENYAHAAMPEGVGRGHSARASTGSRPARERQGQGAAVRQRSDPERSAAAQQILAEKYGVPADVWSVTSYNELRRDALRVERWNRLHPAEPRADAVHPASARRARKVRSSPPRDYMKVVPDQSRPGCRAGWSRWAPMASDAARTASICAGTSR